MAAIILPTRWRKQPQYAAQIDWGNPLTAGLVFCAYPLGKGFYEVITGQTTGHPGALRGRNSVDGNQELAVSAIGSNGATGGQFANQTGLDRLAGINSMFVEGSLEVNASTQNVIRSFESGAGNGIGVQFDDIAAVNNGFGYWANNGGRAFSSSNALGSNSEQFTHRVAFTNDGTNTRFYAKNRLINSPATTILPTANANRRTTMLGTGNTQGAGSLSICLAWNRIISLAEYQALYDNPWQIFKAPERRIFYSAGGAQSFTYTPSGGITYSGIAATVRAETKTVSGGISLAGTSAQVRGRDIAPSGGVSFSGTAAMFRGVVRAITGGLVFSGSAPVSFQSFVQSLTVTPVGGLVISGAAAVVRGCTKAVSGGISFAGSAGVIFNDVVSSFTKTMRRYGFGGRRKR